jgi:hypothetical protein
MSRVELDIFDTVGNWLGTRSRRFHEFDMAMARWVSPPGCVDFTLFDAAMGNPPAADTMR